MICKSSVYNIFSIFIIVDWPNDCRNLLTIDATPDFGRRVII